jgi:hypothetical protein
MSDFGSGVTFARLTLACTEIACGGAAEGGVR